MFRRYCLPVIIAALQLPLLGMAADAPSAINPENGIKQGHSYHGEAFDEGPRRAAYLMKGTGNVTFPVSSKDPRVQAYFNQGIGQLHGFWYFEAERSFRQVSLLDHDCAMAYWGMAFANTNNTGRAKAFIADAVKRKSTASERERMYIDALDAWYKADAGDDAKKKIRAQNYVNALENIVFKFPDDLEAKAFLGLALWQSDRELPITSRFAINALMNEVLEANPLHPAHHFRIHLWDNDKAQQAVNSAERCGLAAPGIAHMWHMSGHTYSQLKNYSDAAWRQEASARTDHAYMVRDMIFPDAIHNFAHNNEWLVQNLRRIGRVHDAVALSRNSIELPRHPKYNMLPGNKNAHYGRSHLFETYSQFELWDGLIADAQTQYLGPSDDERELIKRQRYLGRAYFRKSDLQSGRRQLESLRSRWKRLQQDSADSVAKAVAKARFEGKDTKGVEAAQKQALQPLNDRIGMLERAVQELEGYLLLHDGKFAEAAERFKKNIEADRAANVPSLPDDYLAEVQFQAAKKDEALQTLRKQVDANKNEVRPLAALVQMQWRLDQRNEARQSFESLREISEVIDLDCPVFQRLRPIAVELGFGTDWRTKRTRSPIASELPDLASLGPIHWQPVAAREWALPDADGKIRTLAEFRGRPVIVIFYLGYGCLHCIEQLQAFGPKTAEFQAAGISLIAVSTDGLDDLKKSHQRYKDGVFPFPLVSDDALIAFKRYHAFDDFENVPLHATFLIDADGRIRWHDIAAEPFMNVQFLLKESKRLLYPSQIDPVVDPNPLDDLRPADALDPLNVFPIQPTPAKANVSGG